MYSKPQGFITTLSFKSKYGMSEDFPTPYTSIDLIATGILDQTALTDIAIGSEHSLITQKVCDVCVFLPTLLATSQDRFNFMIAFFRHKKCKSKLTYPKAHR